MTRVLHLSVVHKPDDPRIYERECRTLAEAGYEVMYMVPGAEPGRDDAGVILSPLPERGRGTRFLSSVEITKALRALKPDVLHVHDPELLTLFPAARAIVPKLVYDMHEYVPEAVAGKPYIPAGVRPVASQTTAVAQKSLAALGSGVVVVTEDQLAALGSTPKLRLVLPNYPRVERFEGAEPVPELAADPRLKLIYVGSLSRARGCTLMLDVMEQVEPDEAVLYLGGTFNDPALETEVRERLAGGLADRVKLLGRIPPPRAAALPGGGRRGLGALAARPPVQPPDGPDQAPRGHDRRARVAGQRHARARRARPPRGVRARRGTGRRRPPAGASAPPDGPPRASGDGRSRPPRGRAPLLLGGRAGRFGRLLRPPHRRGGPHVSIERFDNVLVLAPHTDDGEFGCGGTMARLIENGVKVTYAAFSTAAKSVPEGFPKDVLKHEVRAATGVLGIAEADLKVYDFEVRTFPTMRQDILEEMIVLQRELDPDCVLLPALIDLHQDHKTIAEEGLRAFKRTTVMAYEIPWNNLNFSQQAYVRLEERHIEKKVQALACYASQGHRNYLNEDYIRNVALTRGINIGCEYAEVFEVYRWIL